MNSSTHTRPTFKVPDSKNIDLVDSTDDFNMYCYLSCDNSSSDDIKQTRGVITTKNGQLVLMPNGYIDMHEWVWWGNSDDELHRVLSNMGNLRFAPMIEGTALHMFYFNNKWQLSTNRKIDAMTSYWNSERSFGEKFWDAIMRSTGLSKIEFCAYLNTDNTYSFLLPNDFETRVICSVTYNNVFVTNVFNKNFEPSADYPSCLQSALTVVNMSSVDDVFKELDYSKNPGIVVYGDNCVPIMVVHHTYQRLFNMRKNQPPNYFLLECMKNGGFEIIVKNLFSLEINHLTNLLHKLAVYIHGIYITKFVKREDIGQISPSHYFTLCELHSRFINGKNAGVKIKTSFNDVYNLIIAKDTKLILTMLNEFA